MRHASIEFAGLIDKRWNDGQRWDLILVTDMINLAELNGLLQSAARNLPVIAYFHENQFAYPDRQQRQRDQHFAFTNLVSALAADRVWVNSSYNRDSMIQQLNLWMDRWPDFPPRDAPQKIIAKSSIQPPGIEATPRARAGPLQENSPMHILWAARWEHDKNPDRLLRILEGLAKSKSKFLLSVAGKQYSECPASLVAIRERFADRILHWGFCEERTKYLQLLHEADVFLSTADHEFFGIAAAEAIAAGCKPLLPNRLAYPELLSIDGHPERAELLYDTDAQAIERLQQWLELPTADRHSDLANEFRSRFGWENRAQSMDDEAEKTVCEWQG